MLYNSNTLIKRQLWISNKQIDGRHKISKNKRGMYDPSFYYRVKQTLACAIFIFFLF